MKAPILIITIWHTNDLRICIMILLDCMQAHFNLILMKPPPQDIEIWIFSSPDKRIYYLALPCTTNVYDSIYLAQRTTHQHSICNVAVMASLLTLINCAV